MLGMDSVLASRRSRAGKPIVRMLLVALTATSVTACGPYVSESAQEARKPQQAGQPVSPAKMARHIAGARSSMAAGDSKAAEEHVRAMANDVLRSARVNNPMRPIDHEAARAAVSPIPGVRSSVWLDHENLVVVVDGARHRSMAMIDQVCLALEPLGDTLAVVINVQDVTATTPDGATTLSRNCQLPEGQRAFMQRKRAVDVASKELRETFKAQQGRK
jgi:hypothetical protein